MDTGADVPDADNFASSRGQLDTIMAWLASEEAMALDLGTLERELISKGDELLAQVLQDCDNLRLQGEAPLPHAVDAEGVARGIVQ